MASIGSNDEQEGDADHCIIHRVFIIRTTLLRQVMRREESVGLGELISCGRKRV